ncbi:MAG: aminoglycoside phosphotransferase family protein [Actinomycetota bacterium]
MSFRQHLVIPNHSGTHILLIENRSGWMLPRVLADEDWARVEGAQSWGRDRLGLDIAILRCAFVEYDGADQESGDAFLFAEFLGGGTPLSGSWCNEEATSARLGSERERAVTHQWFTEEREGRPRALPPWGYPGWYAGACGWIETTLPGVVGVEQWSTWSVSSILRAQTAAGRYYFKAAPTGFRHEATVTSMLAERFPGAIPAPVAIDAERGWLLTEDFGDELAAGRGASVGDGAVDALVALQRRSVASVDALLEGGCADRRPAVLQTQIADLVEDGSTWLSSEMHGRLRAASPRIAALCEEVANQRIPNTLVHGDFHGWNVALSGGRYLIFDWTDACIAHPFFDMAVILRNVEHSSVDPALRDRWRDRYLDGWRDFVDREEAIRLFERTEPIAAMHQAISYRSLLSSMDPSELWQFGSALEDWVIRALDALAMTT